MSGDSERIGHATYPGLFSWERRPKVFDMNGDLHYTLSRHKCSGESAWKSQMTMRDALTGYKHIVHRGGVPVGFIRKISADWWAPAMWLCWLVAGGENMTAASFLPDESFVGRLLFLRELVVHGRAFERSKESDNMCGRTKQE